jgi:hypothetical protein
MTHHAATPAKLSTGAWGARVVGRADAGDSVTITSQGGKSWEASIERVVWTNGEVTLCATSSSARAATTGRCKGCVRGIKDASHHVAMGGYCGECAFDEFDI